MSNDLGSGVMIFIIFGFFTWLLMRSLDNDYKKRREKIAKGEPINPINIGEVNEIIKVNTAAFKEKYPNYQEQFTDEMVEEIIRGYVHLGKFGYRMKYDALVENGTISEVWFNRILPYCVQRYANEKVRR